MKGSIADLTKGAMESEGNTDRGVYSEKPDYAVLLTQDGMQQALKAGEHLRSLVGEEEVQFYVSPLFRTQQTFQQIIKSFKSDQYWWREEPRLREQEWGNLRSLEDWRSVETQRDPYGTFYFRIPHGESAADVYDRVSDFFHTLFRDFAKPDYPQNAVMITHGVTIRLFLMRWLHYTVTEFEQLCNPFNCDIIVMELQDNGKFKLVTELKKKQSTHRWQLES